MCQENKNPRIKSTILTNTPIANMVFEMVVDCPEIAQGIRPGQFVNLYCRRQGRLLPRPISICEVDRNKGRLHLVYATVGGGTKEFSCYEAGGSIDVMGPLGSGFPLDGADDRNLVVGTGVGTAPLVELCKQLRGETTVVVGFKTDPYLIDRLERYGTVHVATSDGSVGYKGRVIPLMEREGLTSGTLYACGSIPMLRDIQTYARTHGLNAFLSLEERMGCGFGGCVGCVTKIRSDNEDGFVYGKVCKDGPVFTAEEVLLS